MKTEFHAGDRLLYLGGGSPASCKNHVIARVLRSSYCYLESNGRSFSQAVFAKLFSEQKDNGTSCVGNHFLDSASWKVVQSSHSFVSGSPQFPGIYIIKDSRWDGHAVEVVINNGITRISSNPWIDSWLVCNGHKASFRFIGRRHGDED